MYVYEVQLLPICNIWAYAVTMDLPSIINQFTKLQVLDQCKDEILSCYYSAKI